MEIARVISPPKMPASGSGYFYCFAYYEPKDGLPCDIYFSGRDGHHLECHNGVVVFGKPLIRRLPVPGDHIRFRLGNNVNGPIARPWGFADEYDMAAGLAGVSADTLYRVVMSTFKHGHRVTKDEVVCDPMTLEALQKKYPIPWKIDTDSFPKKVVHEEFCHQCQFQRQNVSGVWENCVDPRREPWRT